MQFTDTHTHLYSDVFDNDRAQVIQRALDANVTRFFIPAIDSSHTEAMLKLEADYPKHMHLMTGVHPTSIKNDYLTEIKHVENLLTKRRFIAIGEIGIDLYWDKSTLKIQQAAFKHQIKLAKQYKLPIVIHCRDAFDEVFEILETEKSDDLFGIFHCFTGNIEQAKQAISYNMKLGIGGVVTFKNGKIDQFLNQIDIKHIVLETDAPYLSPTPHRGKRNESSFITLIAEKLCSIYNIDLTTLANITTANSKTVFGI